MLSKKTVIIILVVCSVTITSIILILVIVITKRYSPSSTPLPTIQPLSHHREHHLEQFQHSSTSTSQLSIPRKNEPSYSAVTPPSPDTPLGHHQSPPSNRSRSLASHSSNNRRGVPHGPHSQIQIMLPTPLALNVNASSSTLSIADKWVSAGTPQH